MSIRQSQDYATGALCPINTINVIFTTLLHWTSAHGQNMAIGTTLPYIAIMFYIIHCCPTCSRTYTCMHACYNACTLTLGISIATSNSVQCGSARDDNANVHVCGMYVHDLKVA